MKKLAIAFILAASAATVLAACSSDTTTSSSGGTSGTSGGTSGTSGGTSGTSGTNAGSTSVTVKSNEFVPASVTIKKGDSVTWVWAGGTHNVVSGGNCTSDGKFTSGNPTGTNGNTFQQTFNDTGTFEYFCNPHCASSNMKGTVIVQ